MADQKKPLTCFLGLFTGIALLALILDQATKHWAYNALLEIGHWPVFKHIFDLTLVKNSGGVWGFFPGSGTKLAWVGIIVAFLVAAYWWFNRPRSAAATVALALIFGGSLGNLIDRLSYGWVIDFLDFKFWPVFNLADTFTNIGLVILVIYLWRQSCTPSYSK